MMGSVKQLQQIQQRMVKVQEELANETVTASVGGGVVSAVMTGSQQLKSIRIEPEAIDASDITMLEDLIVAAVNEALNKSQELAAKKMSAVTGNMRLPGLF